MKFPGLATAIAIFALPLTALPTVAKPVLNVTYAGSMGVVMDKGLGPAFAQRHDVDFHGQGKGAYAMARLIASKQVPADVFVSINPGPMDILKQAGLIETATPIASTSMVIAYNPQGKFGAAFNASARPDATTPWYKILEDSSLKFGRTDPVDDPQGQNIIFTLELAEKYYHEPDLEAKALGPVENPAQVFLEGNMLARLEAGQIDASSGYKAAVLSAGLPFIALPDQINLSNPDMTEEWYSKAAFEVKNHQGVTETKRVQPLVYYTAVLKTASDPKEAQAFVDYLKSADGQKLLSTYGYDAPKGGDLYR